MLVIGHRANNIIKVRNYLAQGVDAIELDITSSGIGHGSEGIKPATLREALIRRLLSEPSSNSSVMVEELIDARVPIIVDIKVRKGFEPFFNPFLGRGEGVMISSKFHPVIRALRESGLMVPMFASIQERPVRPSQVMKEAKADGLTVELSYVDRELVDEIHSIDGLVFVWTVNDIDQALGLSKLGVDAIITDRPDLIIPALRKGVRDRSLTRELYRWLTS